MILAAIYSCKEGKSTVESRFAQELREIERVIAEIDSASHKTKVSRENPMPGKALYRPRSLDQAFRAEFESRGWQKHKVRCEYPIEFYQPGYTPVASSRAVFREMDFIKNRLGVEVQFGKYAFMVYNVCAKMTI